MPFTRTGPRARPKVPRTAPAEANAQPVDAALIRVLAELIGTSDLAELEIEKGDLRIRLVRRGTSQVLAAAVSAPVLGSTAHASSEASALATSDDVSVLSEDHPGTVKSPMVGTVYVRSSPEAKAFVEVGAVVKTGDRVLLVEAMKTFNDIVAPRAGTVTAMFVEDGQPVEYGQPLLVIE